MTGPPCCQSPQLTLLNLLYTALPLHHSAAGPRYGTIHFPGTFCTQALLGLLSLHPYSNNVCPVQGWSSSVNSESISAHFLAEHTSLDITIKHCVDCLINCSDDILTYGKGFNQIFKICTTVINLHLFTV